MKTRFAPSPTGFLHIGGARTALFNYLYARHSEGIYLLRIEDTDTERSKDQFTEDILNGLAWLGMEWDEGPYFQRERMDIYREHAYRLLEEGKAYKCFCTPEELEQRRQNALNEGRKPLYDRKCRERGKDDTDKPFVIRFKTPLSGTVSFHDIIRGTITFNCEELDDLVIFRSDNTPTYNFTVVVDDALMEVTHIVRGDDHINNTPRQVLIYQALGYEPPEFAHVPLIHGKDKGRLSKRHGATSLLEYKNEGFLPEALMNYLARLGWAHGDQEIFTREELIEKFDLSHVGKSPSIFDMDKLLWLNGYYIKQAADEKIAEMIVPFIEGMGVKIERHDMLVPVVKTLKERAKTLKEMASMALFYFVDDVEYESKAMAKYLSVETKPILEAFLDRFLSLPSLGEPEQKELIEGLAGKFGKKIVDIVQPVRVALSGRTVTPGIFDVMYILGRDTVIKRITKAIANIS